MISAAILLLGMFYMVCLIRKRRMELKYALPWLAVSFAALIVDCFPKLLSILADLIGVATPVNALFLVAFLFSISLLFALTVIVSRQSERIKQLVQAAALCEERVKRLESERMAENVDAGSRKAGTGTCAEKEEPTHREGMERQKRNAEKEDGMERIS